MRYSALLGFSCFVVLSATVQASCPIDNSAKSGETASAQLSCDSEQPQSGTDSFSLGEKETAEAQEKAQAISNEAAQQHEEQAKTYAVQQNHKNAAKSFTSAALMHAALGNLEDARKMNLAAADQDEMDAEWNVAQGNNQRAASCYYNAGITYMEHGKSDKGVAMLEASASQEVVTASKAIATGNHEDAAKLIPEQPPRIRTSVIMERQKR